MDSTLSGQNEVYAKVRESRPDFYTLHAREKAGLPAEWRLYKWEAFPHTGDTVLYIEVTGAVALQKYTKGRHKGQTNWSKKSCKRTVVLTCEEHDQWLARWEQQTGKCHRCGGTGEQWCGWNHLTGDRFRPCGKCKATGKAPSVGAVTDSDSATGVSSK